MVIRKSHWRTWFYRVSTLFLAFSLPTMPIAAQTINRYVISSGGQHSTGGDYRLTSTIGQASAQVSSTNQYILSGGFWTQTQRPDLMFKDDFEGDSPRESSL